MHTKTRFWHHTLPQLKIKSKDLPRKPFSMFYPWIITRLPAAQASITAETLDIIVTTFNTDKWVLLWDGVYVVQGKENKMLEKHQSFQCLISS